MSENQNVIIYFQIVKNLVQITTKGEQKKLLPTFKIVNDAALEVLLRKSRSNQTNESFAVFDLDGSESAAKRVKQKTFVRLTKVKWVN